MYLLGLHLGAEPKNSWTIAEQAGELIPHGMQTAAQLLLLGRRAVRDDLRSYVLEQLGDRAGVVVADETGFLTEKCGLRRSFGVVANAPLGHRDPACGNRPSHLSVRIYSMATRLPIELQVIPRFTDEKAAMKLMFASPIRAADRWYRASISD